MKVDKLSVSFPPELGDDVRTAAEREGVGVSHWLAAAAQSRLADEAFDRFIADWEAEQGPFTEAEVRAGAEALGLPYVPRTS